jgi:integrase/recombinase XerD
MEPTNRRRYGVSLKQIEGFLRPLFIDEVDRETVSDIVKARRDTGVSTATIRRDLVALSSVLGFAIGEGWRGEGNPALERLGRLTERRDPIVLPEPADVERVIARAPGNFKYLIRAARLTGCRQEELVTAERRRLDHRTRQLTVIGKGNKLRVLQLSDEAYALFRSMPVNLATRWLFWHGSGEPYANVSSRFALFVASAHRAAQREGADFRPFRFHDLRHLYAVEYLKSGGNIYALQGQLGHGSVKVTEAYLAYLTPEEALAAKHEAARISAQRQRSGGQESA